jgi:hypothetical protein
MFASTRACATACFVERQAAGTHWSPLERAAKHIDAGASRTAQRIKDTADAAPQTAVQGVDDVASGKVMLSTLGGQAKAAAEEALRRCGKLQCVEDAVEECSRPPRIGGTNPQTKK